MKLPRTVPGFWTPLHSFQLAEPPMSRPSRFVSPEEVGGHALALLRLFFRNQKYPVGFTAADVRRLDRDSAHCCFPLPRPDAGGTEQETEPWLDGGRVDSAAGWENKTSPSVCSRGRQSELKILCLFHE